MADHFPKDYPTYLVPKDTRQALLKQGNPGLNMGLALGRFVPEEAIYNDDVVNDRGRAVDKVRSRWLKAVCELVDPRYEETLQQIIAHSINRWGQQTRALGARRFELALATRLIVGLGGKGALEFGITLHPVTGLPYIPGSALKGMLRSTCLLLLAEKWQIEIEAESLTAFEEGVLAGQYDREIEDEHLLSPAEFRVTFGSQAQAGAAVFFDALVSAIPVNSALFTPEVMTPHFRTYYEGAGREASPHDGDNPNPVTFLAVGEGVRFGFAIGVRRGAARLPLKKVTALLKDALTTYGIGAKTAAGYGVFREV